MIFERTSDLLKTLWKGEIDSKMRPKSLPRECFSQVLQGVMLRPNSKSN